MPPKKKPAKVPAEHSAIRSLSKFNISSMSEEEIQEMMESISSAEESEIGSDFDDDSVADPTYQLSPEEDAEIDRHLSSSYLSEAINLSLNLSNLSIPLAESTPPTPSIEQEQQYECEAGPSSVYVEPPLLQQVEQETGPASSDMPPPSIQYLRTKPPKRGRSPLPELDEIGPNLSADDGNFAGNNAEINVKSTEFSKILWRKKNLVLHRNEVAFRGETELPASFRELKTEYACISYFFTDEIFEKIAQETNLKAHQANIATTFLVTAADIRKYVGILIYMSVYKYPSIARYWGEHAFVAIRDTMPRNRFEEIRQYLCFNDETNMKKKGEEGYDPLFKIRPLVDHLN